MNRLYDIAKLLNTNNITWALGGKSLLDIYGIGCKNKLIHILVTESDIEKTYGLLKETVNDDIRVVSGLDINNRIYEFTKEDIKSSFMMKDQKVYTSHIIDWYLYFKSINDQKSLKQLVKYYQLGNFINTERLYHFENKINDDLFLNCLNDVLEIRMNY